STRVSWPAGSSSRRATRIRGMYAPRLRLPLPRSQTRLQLVLQDEGAVEPGHVLPAHLGGLTHGLDRLGLLLGSRRVTLDDRVAALAVHLVGLDVDREELDLVVGEAVVRLERRQVALVDARHLRLEADQEPRRGDVERSMGHRVAPRGEPAGGRQLPRGLD